MDDNQIFQDLVSRIGAVPDPAVSISLWDINNAIKLMNECAMYLGEVINISLGEAAFEPPTFPQELVVQLPQLVKIIVDVADLAHDMTCDSCDEEADCDCSDGDCELCRDEDDDEG